MIKPAASRKWVCTLCLVPVLAILAAGLLALSGVRHGGAPAAASFAPEPAPATSAARRGIQATYAALPLAFEQNLGQTDSQVKYMARGQGYTLFLTANDAVFSLPSRNPAAAKKTTTTKYSPGRPHSVDRQEDSVAVLRMRLAGGNPLATVSASSPLPGSVNYLLGNDPEKWHTHIARFARVSYQNVYPGVNLAFHGEQRQLEFDFVVARDASPAPIGFQFSGTQGVKTDHSGNLVISSAGGDVLLHRPVAYQEQDGARQSVDARFVLKAGNQVGFEIGNYDRNRELVIDPSVSYEYSTYLGGSEDDEGEAITFDSNGNAYVTGQTGSSNFPGASGFTGTANVFVTKISANGQNLIYSTLVGGSGPTGDSGNSIALDSSGDVFVAGGTTSSNFPTTSGAFQTKLGTGATGNAFAFELSPDGSALTYSTYLGGGGDDVALGIALDTSGNAYVGGATTSSNFPTQSPLQAFPGGTNNGFITKLNSTGTALVYSTYLDLGGGSIASLNAIALDSSKNAYVTGAATGSGFHTTAGAFQPNFVGGTADAFVTVLNASGNGYVYSTFLGGSASDVGNGIAVESSGSAGFAYVTGSTASTDFPHAAALQGTYGGGDTDAFVTKLNTAGTATVYSTFLGGTGSDQGAGIAVDGSSPADAYVTGITGSSDFPRVSATQSALGGGIDAFVSEINGAGSALAFSTYLGGTGNEDNGGDFGAIAVNGSNSSATIFVTGNTGSSSGFPLQSAFQNTFGGGDTDAFVVKYAQGPTFNVTATTPAAVAPGSSATSTVTLTALNGYNSAVNLNCSVSGGGSPAPACSTSSFSPDAVTPTPTGATSTLTITTTGASGALFAPRKVFYAMWLPIAGMALAGFGFSGSRSHRKKMLGFLIIGMVMTALFLMPACGGSSSGGGGGGGCAGCTPAGSYTVTITGTGTDASTTAQSAQLKLTVN